MFFFLTDISTICLVNKDYQFRWAEHTDGDNNSNGIGCLRPGSEMQTSTELNRPTSSSDFYDQCVYSIKTSSFIGKIPMTISGVSFSTILNHSSCVLSL